MHKGEKNIRFQVLLGSLFFYLIFAPFLADFPYTYITMNALLTFFLLSTIFVLQKNRIFRLISILILLLIFIPLWLNLLGILKVPSTFIYICLSLYLAIVICSLVTYFFSSKKVTANVIYAALCLYLLIGILWGTLFAFIETLLPGSFQGWIINFPDVSELRLHGFIYFSFTTLTTLGYGDITPQTLQSAALCQTEAIMGQFFISVLIAQLIGIHIAQRMKKQV